MEHSTVQSWLDRYIAAWREGDREAIAALFERNAQYRYHPADDPIRGSDAIAESWLENPDPPGSWDAWYRPWIVEDDRAVATGASTYFADDGSVDKVYDNCFLLRFNAQGQCSEFTEWFVKRRADQAEGG